MKLSQFKFKLPEDQIALYPHGFIREFENEKEKRNSSVLYAVMRHALWFSTVNLER